MSDQQRRNSAEEPTTYPTEDERNANPDQSQDNPEHQPDRDASQDGGNNKADGKSGSDATNSVEDEKEAAARKEREAVAELEARLPRPDWYSSDDEESQLSSQEEEKLISEFRTRAEGGLGLLIVYTVLALICFVFNLASSCPIPWMKGKGDHSGREYGVWRAKKGGLPDLKVNNIHDCSQEMQYWQAAAAFSVMATVASFGAFISGLLMCLGVGHLGATFALSFYSTVFPLVSWSLVAHLFGYNCCNKYKYKDIARLDAGFALTLIAFVLMLVGVIVLGVYFATYYTRSVNAGIIRPLRFVYLTLLIIVAVFTCVGPAFTQWKKDFPLVKVKVTMWHIEVEDKASTLSTYLGRKWYKCSTFTRRMKVVAAFNILGNIWLAFAILFATGACYKQALKFSASFMGWLSAIFSLVAWLVLIVTRHGHLCTSQIPAGVSLWTDMGYNGIPSGYENGQIVYDGYSMGEGFALMVTGWALTVVACIINIF